MSAIAHSTTPTLMTVTVFTGMGGYAGPWEASKVTGSCFRPVAEWSSGMPIL